MLPSAYTVKGGKKKKPREDSSSQLQPVLTIGMKHLGHKSDNRRFIGILLTELHGELKCAILKWGIFRSIKKVKLK